MEGGEVEGGGADDDADADGRLDAGAVVDAVQAWVDLIEAARQESSTSDRGAGPPLAAALALMHSMLEHNDNLATFIILMTRDVTSVSSDEARIAAAAFAIRAQIKSLAKEYPDVVLSTVEIVDQSVITPMMLAPIMARSEAFTLAGEVLSRHSPEAALEVSSETGRPLQFSRDSVQIISGGLGGVGLETARWMVDCGARKLVLFGRAAPDDKSTLVINELTKLGATIEVMQADVGRLEDVERTLCFASPLRC